MININVNHWIWVRIYFFIIIRHLKLLPLFFMILLINVLWYCNVINLSKALWRLGDEGIVAIPIRSGRGNLQNMLLRSGFKSLVLKLWKTGKFCTDCIYCCCFPLHSCTPKKLQLKELILTKPKYLSWILGVDGKKQYLTVIGAVN